MGNRFHAWQSALTFSALFVLHLIFSWTAFISWLLFIFDIGLIAHLTWRAYKDGASPSLSIFILVTSADKEQRIHSIASKSPSLARWQVQYWMTNEMDQVGNTGICVCGMQAGSRAMYQYQGVLSR